MHGIILLQFTLNNDVTAGEKRTPKCLFMLTCIQFLQKDY